MKVTLITDFNGLMAYKNGNRVFEAVAKYASKTSRFVHEIVVDVEEVQSEANGIGYVYVQRKAEE